MATRKVRRRVPEEERKHRNVIVRLTDAEADALAKLSEKRNLPVSYFVRQAIAQLLEREKE
jgi:predicted transcriptional regulator